MSKKDEDKDEEQFHAAMGRAVIAFTDVETTAAVLFCSMLKAKNTAGAVNVLWRMTNFSSRIDSMDVAAKWLLKVHAKNPALAEQWDALRVRLFAASDLRNRIAHSALGEGDGGFHLRLPFTDWSRVDPGQLEKSAKARFARYVTEEQVKGAAGQFFNLSYDLHQFREQVDGVKIQTGRRRVGRARKQPEAGKKAR